MNQQTASASVIALGCVERNSFALSGKCDNLGMISTIACKKWQSSDKICMPRVCVSGGPGRGGHPMFGRRGEEARGGGDLAAMGAVEDSGSAYKVHRNCKMAQCNCKRMPMPP